MKQKSFLYLFAFLAFILIVGLACSSLTTSPTQAPATNPPVQPQQPSNSGDQPTPEQSSSGNTSSGGLTTFTDKNKLYSIDVPSDWVQSQNSGDYYYADIFASPDKAAKVENLVYNDGTAFTGSQNGKFALYLLNTFYSNTGKEGDIKVTDDAIQKDGSERLTWTSRGGGYSGVSFFEIRGSDRATFLMFTCYWLNSAENQYLDTINAIIASYRTP